MITDSLIKKLQHTIEVGDAQNLAKLLKNKGIESAILDDEKNTPLHLAVYYGHSKIVKMLLDSGLTQEHITQHNEYGQTALAYAAEKKNKELIDLLVEAMQLSLEQLKELIITCLKKQYTDVAKVLVTRLSDEQLQSQDGQGCTLLMMAASYANQAIVKAIISRVPIEQIVQKDNEGKTALMWAAKKGSKAVVKLFLSKLNEDQIAVKDNKNKNALMHAACGGHPEIFELLSSSSQPFSKQEIFALVRAIAQESNCAILSVAGPLCDASESITDGESPEYRKQLIKGEKGRAKIVAMLLQDSAITLKDGDDLIALLLQAGLNQEDIWMQQPDEEVQEAIHKAIRAADVKYLALLLSRLSTKQLQLQDEDGWTPFMRALYEYGYGSEKYKKNVDLFLPYLDALTPQDLCTQSKKGDTAFLYAARYGSYEAVKYLISRLTPEQMSIQNASGSTALMHSVWIYDCTWEVAASALELILNSGLSLEQINVQNKYGWTAFMYAATGANNALVSLFLKAGLTWDDISNAFDRQGRTVLMYAAQNGDLEEVRSLLSRFSEDEVNVQDEQGMTAFMFAVGAFRNSQKIVDLFLKKDTQCAWATIQDKDGKTLLMHAIELGDEDLTELLLSKLSLEQTGVKDVYGWTAFMRAIRRGNDEITQLFIAAGASLAVINNLPDENGETMLMSAAQNGDIEAVRLLLDRLPMSNVQAGAIDGETALLMAAESGRYETFKMLISHIGKLTEQEQKYLLWRAYTGDNKDVFQLILQKKANDVSFDTLNWCNDSLLMDAAKAGKTWIIEILLPYLSHGQILFKNDFGETVFDIASSEKIKKMIQDRLDELN